MTWRSPQIATHPRGGRWRLNWTPNSGWRRRLSAGVGRYGRSAPCVHNSDVVRTDALPVGQAIKQSDSGSWRREQSRADVVFVEQPQEVRKVFQTQRADYDGAYRPRRKAPHGHGWMAQDRQNRDSRQNRNRSGSDRCRSNGLRSPA